MKSQFTKERVGKFLSYYKPHWKIFAVDMGCVVLCAAAFLLFPLVSGYITGEVLSGGEASLQGLLAGGLALLALYLVRVASEVTYAYLGHAMGAKMERTMREELFRHYEEQSFAFHARNSVGKLMTVISNDLTGMTELFHHGPEDLVMALIKFVGAFVILLCVNVPLTLIVFVMLPVLTLITLRMDKAFERINLRSRADLSALNERVEDTLAGIRTVKAFGNEEAEFRRFAEKNDAYTKSMCLFYKLESYFYNTLHSYPQFLTMLAVFFGALFLGNGSLDVPVLVTFLLYVGSMAEPVNYLLNFMRLYEEGKAGFLRFMEMMETQPAVTEDPHPVELPQVEGEIAFHNVTFRYEDSPENVLENLSFRIRPGQCAAFAGASGIGKTTVCALMARFYDPCEGSVTLDGADLRQISFRSLRDAVGVVQQEVYIFNGTIRENICYGRPDATEEEMVRAAKLADIHSFICSLPQGYDSQVGTKGIKLSGGQRQRLSIARLFLKDPKILILDEATSALDYESEVAVQASIERLMKGRTCIVIAHRLSTIRNADVIYVLKEKKIAEQGSHQELLALGGEYAKLCEFGRL